MANHKNQHYVPQFYLRNFSSDGKTIGMLLKGKNLTVPNAPIANQCSENFFYGNQELESALGKIESKTSSVIKKVLEDKGLSNEDLSYLKQFTIIQTYRTLQAAKRIKAILESLLSKQPITDQEKTLYEEASTVGDKNSDVILYSLKSAISNEPYTEFWDIAILCNTTKVPFITSDNPSLFFNAYQLYRREPFGYRTPGAEIYMPISSQYAVFLYDSLIYGVEEQDANTIYLEQENVLALNYHQILGANEAIYFEPGRINVQSDVYFSPKPLTFIHEL